MITLLLNHIWQSTVCAGLVGLLILLVRNNGAHVRFALWFAASLKFLVPFSLIAMIGAAIWPQNAQIASAPFVAQVQPIIAHVQSAAEPFAPIEPSLEKTLPRPIGFDDLLLVIWLAGAALLLISWVGKYLKLMAAVRNAVPLAAQKGIPIRSTRELVEPGLVGIWRPVLLLPEGIETHLTEAEMCAIIAHEMCHARRRDNLTAAISMMVQAIFWFYPLTWWIGQRLVAEREKACDEAVVTDGNDPSIYAGSILKICKFYLRSPLDCASGVSGADLKKRVEAIMENRFVARLGKVKKATLAGIATIAIGIPVAAGMIPSPVAFALARTTPSPGTEVALRRYIDAWEKHRPDYGVFRFPVAQLQARNQTLREFEDWGALKSITFRRVNAMGWDVYFVAFENGSTIWQIAPLAAGGKISAMNWSVAYVRTDKTKPSLGTEMALRRQIEGWERHRPQFNAMTPQMIMRTRAQETKIQRLFDRWGALKSVAFNRVSNTGWDVYDVTFEHGQGIFSIGPLTSGGKIDALSGELVFNHPGKGPSPGTRAALRRIIMSLAKGSPIYDQMTPQLASGIRTNLARLLPRIKAYGPLESVKFKSVSPNGVNIYEVVFRHGSAECRTAPLTKDGKIRTFFFYPEV